MIQRIVTYRVRPDTLAAAQEAIAEFVAGIAAHEPATNTYHAYQYRDDETQFVHTMTFTDEAARDLHAETDHVRAFVDRLYPLCVDPPAFRDVVTVASSSDPRTA